MHQYVVIVKLAGLQKVCNELDISTMNYPQEPATKTFSYPDLPVIRSSKNPTLLRYSVDVWKKMYPTFKHAGGD